MERLLLNRIDLGYEDPRTGEKLDSIDGLKNRPRVDPFRHRGWKYSDVYYSPKVKVKKSKQDVIYLEMDITPEQAKNIEQAETKFKAKRLTKEEAKNMLESTFGIIETESGVT